MHVTVLIAKNSIFMEQAANSSLLFKKIFIYLTFIDHLLYAKQFFVILYTVYILYTIYIYIYTHTLCCLVLCLVAQSCLTLCDPMDCSMPGSSVHGDSPGKNTGEVAMPSSRGFPQPRYQTQVSCIAGRFFTD